MKLTSVLFDAFLKCPTKCYLRSTGQAGSGNAYAEWVREQNDAYRAEAGKRLMAALPEAEVVVSPPVAEDLKAAKWRLALDVPAHAGDMESRLHGVERVPPQGRGKPAKSISRLFGLRIGDSTVNNFKTSAAAYNAEIRQGILTRMIEGKIIHADETTIALKDRSGYVWIFASLHAVVFFYADTREGDVVRDKLNDFKGALVSDFYAAYDSLACPQQKCLLHLMRDLNEAVLAVPFDEQLRQIALGFGVLLKSIVETIDRWGRKRRFLKKHLADVDRFYRQYAKADYQSEAALKCRDRFDRNKKTLFTFLSYDGIPWNNNNAEHAIKAFARLRRVIGGLSTAKGIDEYLVLLSICQTCKYSGLDFLDFLLSGEKDIAAAHTHPNRVMSQPPMSGPTIIGTRRTIDCTPSPIVCWCWLSDVAITVKVAGNDKAHHARNKNDPTSSASQCCQTSTST